MKVLVIIIFINLLYMNWLHLRLSDIKSELVELNETKHVMDKLELDMLELENI